MSLIIPINKKYQLKYDGRSWEVGKWKNRTAHPDGGNYEGVKWLSTLQGAGEWLVLHLVSQDDLRHIDDIIRAIEAASLLITYAISASDLDDKHHDIEIYISDVP